MRKKAAKSPWIIREDQFNPTRQHQRETIFTTGNGYLSTRGSFEEGYPLDRQATLIHGLWDDVPIAFSELVNSPDWTKFEIWCNDIRFSMLEENILTYSRALDLRNGCLSRKIKWSPDDGQTILLLEFERFTSLSDQHIACLQVKITPLSRDVSIRIRASIDSHVENNGILHWNLISQDASIDQSSLVLVTRKTSIALAISMALKVQKADARRYSSECQGNPGIELISGLEKGKTLIVEKYASFVTSNDSPKPLKRSRELVRHSLETGYQALKDDNNRAWLAFWSCSDVIIDGDDEAQIALRHALFQLRIAAPTHNQHVSIGAKTLSGFGYRGHVFWDTEIFVLPFFTFTQPGISRNMLLYRYHTLGGARRKALRNGYLGAQYAWESAETGDEVTPTWVPDFRNALQLVRIWTGDIEIHITSDIVYAFHQYWRVTGDDEFWMDNGIPILFETALFWGSRAELDNERFVIRDVIGPDEYHEHVDNNVFTNYMVKWHLSLAIEMYTWLQSTQPSYLKDLEESLDISERTISCWQNIRNNMVILHDPDTGLMEQFEGFFQLKEVDWSKYRIRTKSMQELLGIEGANQHQVLKQADVIMLLCLMREEFDYKTWKANWDYYNPRTDHTYGSSLGPAIQAWAACEMGQPDVAYEHFMRASRADLFDIRGNANDGIHAASAGGLWQAIAFGFSGLTYQDKALKIKPTLPSNWKAIKFPITFMGEKYVVEINSSHQEIRPVERHKLDLEWSAGLEDRDLEYHLP